MKEKMILPCLRGLIGDWVYYSTLMSAEQISKWIKPVKDIREAKSLDEVLQRDLKERKKQIAKYLLTDKNRFFNSLVVGVFGSVPEWFEFDLSKASSVIPLDKNNEIKQSVGIMVFSGEEQMFAIDGQHRVAGIEIANLEDTNEILINDQFSVILLAHVDDFLGMKRTRKLFSDINKNAKPISGGDKIKIDESDLNAIVTRRIFAEYEYFGGGELISITENANLEKDDSIHFTNLLGLYNTHKILQKLFRKKPKSDLWDEENVKNFQKLVEDFYNFSFKHINDYKDYFIKKKLSLKEARFNNSYLLFRPIGLKLIAKLYVHYYQNNKLEEFSHKINKLSFILPNSPFNAILWNNGKMEARETYQRLAYDISLYIFGEFDQNKVDELLVRYRELTKNSEAVLPKQIS